MKIFKKDYEKLKRPSHKTQKTNPEINAALHLLKLPLWHYISQMHTVVFYWFKRVKRLGISVRTSTFI